MKQRGLEQTLLRNPDDAEACSKLAALYASQGRRQSARVQFERALILDPGQIGTRLQYAELLWRLNDPKAALANVDRVLRRAPKIPEAHALRGLILRELGRNDEGIEALKQGWSLSPPSVAAGRALADWDLIHGKTSSAIARLRICLAYEPGNVATRIALAEALERDSRYEESAAQWQALVDRGEGGADAHYRLAEARLRLDQWRGAYDAYETGRRINPQHKSAASLQRLLAHPPATTASLPNYPDLRQP